MSREEADKEQRKSREEAEKILGTRASRLRSVPSRRGGLQAAPINRKDISNTKSPNEQQILMEDLRLDVYALLTLWHQYHLGVSNYTKYYLYETQHHHGNHII